MNINFTPTNMTLLSDPKSQYSHRIRLIIEEKGLEADICNIDPEETPAILEEINASKELPTLVDRKLVTYGTSVITLYLDERYPQIPLTSVLPITRALQRQELYILEKHLFSKAESLLTQQPSNPDSIRKEISDILIAISQKLEDHPYFMGEEFTALDCALVPLLWRLPLLDISIDKEKAPGLHKYMDNLFARETFRKSLSEWEIEIHV